MAGSGCVRHITTGSAKRSFSCGESISQTGDNFFGASESNKDEEALQRVQSHESVPQRLQVDEALN
jgi:hypothetical protein